MSFCEFLLFLFFGIEKKTSWELSACNTISFPQQVDDIYFFFIQFFFYFNYFGVRTTGHVA